METNNNNNYCNGSTFNPRTNNNNNNKINFIGHSANEPCCCNYYDLINMGYDYNICVGKSLFHVHKSLLATESEFFSYLFENNPHHLEINDIDDVVIYKILSYIYTKDTLNLDLHNYGLKILLAAWKFKLKHLHLLCEEYLLITVNFANILCMLVYADFCKAFRLKETAIKYIFAHGQGIISTPEYKAMLAMHPNLKEELCEKMTSINTESNKNNNKRKNLDRKFEEYGDDFDNSHKYRCLNDDI